MDRVRIAWKFDRQSGPLRAADVVNAGTIEFVARGWVEDRTVAAIEAVQQGGADASRYRRRSRPRSELGSVRSLVAVQSTDLVGHTKNRAPMLL
jgi:hypothetical protein